MDLQTLLPQLIPRAIAWAEAVAAHVEEHGETLSGAASVDAKAVGVQFPDKVRVLTVEQIPFPEDSDLRAVAIETGLLGPNIDGLTLGYSILVRRGHMSRSLLSHECRHVAQYETAGGIASFLPVYIEDIVRVGYWNSSFEQNAREYELPDAE